MNPPKTKGIVTFYSQDNKSDKKTYILVAHNGIARVVQSYFHDMTNEEFAAYGIKNCEIKRYDF